MDRFATFGFKLTAFSRTKLLAVAGQLKQDTLTKSNLGGVPLSCIRIKTRQLIAICSDAEVLGWFRKSVEKKCYRIGGS
jgi:hypothetical protein